MIQRLENMRLWSGGPPQSRRGDVPSEALTQMSTKEKQAGLSSLFSLFSLLSSYQDSSHLVRWAITSVRRPHTLQQLTSANVTLFVCISKICHIFTSAGASHSFYVSILCHHCTFRHAQSWKPWKVFHNIKKEGHILRSLSTIFDNELVLSALLACTYILNSRSVSCASVREQRRAEEA